MINISFICINFASIILSPQGFIVSYYRKSFIYFFALYFKYIYIFFISSSHFLISSFLFLISLFLIFFEKSPSIVFSSWFSTSTCFIAWSSIAFIYFSNALPSGEHVNLACSIILLWSHGNISSPVRYTYLSILPMIILIFLQLLC